MHLIFQFIVSRSYWLLEAAKRNTWSNVRSFYTEHCSKSEEMDGKASKENACKM